MWEKSGEQKANFHLCADGRRKEHSFPPFFFAFALFPGSIIETFQKPGQQTCVHLHTPRLIQHFLSFSAPLVTRFPTFAGANLRAIRDGSFVANNFIFVVKQHGVKERENFSWRNFAACGRGRQALHCKQKGESNELYIETTCIVNSTA